jgi:hypothetical protein
MTVLRGSPGVWGSGYAYFLVSWSHFLKLQVLLTKVFSLPRVSGDEEPGGAAGG